MNFEGNLFSKKILFLSFVLFLGYFSKFTIKFMEINNKLTDYYTNDRGCRVIQQWYGGRYGEVLIPKPIKSPFTSYKLISAPV